MDDQYFMQFALQEAQYAALKNEIPIGAVIVDHYGNIIAKSHNHVISDCNPCSHAEILAISQACAQQNNYRLINCTIYTTVEPCVMCIGAILHARISTLVYSTDSPLYGFSSSKLVDLNLVKRTLHIKIGVLAPDINQLMQIFFNKLRNK